VYLPPSDELKGPEAIPEYEQAKRFARVVRIHYSVLYGHLDAEKLLPKLPDKDLISDAKFKAAKSYQQRFAKNAVVIDALLKFDRPSHGLLKFCDTLETIPGQEHIRRKLLKGINLLLHRNIVFHSENGRKKQQLDLANYCTTQQGYIYVTHDAIWLTHLEKKLRHCSFYE